MLIKHTNDTNLIRVIRVLNSHQLVLSSYERFSHNNQSL